MPFHLTTREYYQTVADRLSEDGVYMTNIISPWKGERARFFQAMLRTLRNVFPEVLIFTLERNPTDPQNVILAAFKKTRGTTTPAFPPWPNRWT